MRTSECPREREVFAAVADGRWLSEGHDLATHARDCERCAEALELARAFGNDYAEATGEARPPSAGAMWWRIELRARREAARAATRPITLAQGIAAAAAVGMLAAIAGMLVPWVRGWGTRLAGYAMPEAWSPLTAWSPLALVVALLLATLVVLAPLAVYLAVSEDRS